MADRLSVLVLLLALTSWSAAAAESAPEIPAPTAPGPETQAVENPPLADYAQRFWSLDRIRNSHNPMIERFRTEPAAEGQQVIRGTEAFVWNPAQVKLPERKIREDPFLQNPDDYGSLPVEVLGLNPPPYAFSSPVYGFSSSVGGVGVDCSR